MGKAILDRENEENSYRKCVRVSKAFGIVGGIWFICFAAFGILSIVIWADGITLGSDAFFPFSDNIERAYKSGVKYVAQPGGSIRDQDVIDACNKHGMAMAFTGLRLFHH